jgi:AraC family transcriptional regulator
VSFHPCRSSGIIEECVVENPAAELLDVSPGVGRLEREMSARDSRWQPPTFGESSVNIELKSINASVRVVVSDGQAVVASQQDAALEQLRFKAAGDNGGEAVISFPAEGGTETRRGTNSRLDQDPLVAKLSEALAAAERDQSEFGAIYADAIRLATVARMLSIRSWPEPFARRSQDRSQDAPHGLSKWRLKRVANYVAEHIGDKVTLADMAAAARLSRMHFAALFLRSTGLRPHEYLLRERIAAARELLLSSDRTIVEVALSVGFQTQAHFTTVFKRVTGSTPARWRENRRTGERSFNF